MKAGRFSFLRDAVQGVKTLASSEGVIELGRNGLSKLEQIARSSAGVNGHSGSINSDNSDSSENQEITELINSYYTNHEKRMYEHASRVVGNRYTNLRDYIQKRMCIEDTLEKGKLQASTLGLAKRAVEVGDALLSDKLGIEKETGFIKELLEKFRSASENSERIADLRRQLYTDIAKGVQGYASLKRIEPEEVIASNEYMDEVIRMAFSKRERVEGIYRQVEELEEGRLRVLRDAQQYLTSNLVPKVLQQHIPSQPIPSEKAYKAFVDACRSFRAVQFDRIYGGGVI